MSTTSTKQDVTTHLNLFFSEKETTYDDKLRWLEQDVTFHHEIKWALLQRHGGPCGVLAAIQAELLRYWFFDESHAGDSSSNDKENEKRDEDDALAVSLSRILVRASSSLDSSIKLVLPANDDWRMYILSEEITAEEATKQNFASAFQVHSLEEKDIIPFLLENIRNYTQPGGIFLLCLSLIETRAVSQIRKDMDDPQNTTLTTQYGHCTQEFLNLLLTGAATSNAFDHSINLGGGHNLKGINSTPCIGYLTQLEHLRYCTIGSYYKCPSYPIWVVGSIHHFSVLFSMQKSILDKDEEEFVYEHALRVFQKVDEDNVAEENGFIRASSLSKVIEQLDLMTAVGGQHGIQTLTAFLEVNGADIILWTDFWKIAKPLLLKQVSSLEEALSLSHDSQSSKSDEQVAKDLAASFHSTTSQEYKSDEDYARELQAQFDAELANSSSSSTNVPANSSSATSWTAESSTVSSGTSTALIVVDNDNKLNTIAEEATSSKEEVPRQQQKEEEQKSFTLSHYNGLHGGIFTTFSIVPTPSSSSFDRKQGVKKSGVDGLEDVIRTKWPHCIFDWGESASNEENKSSPAVSLID